MNFGNWEESLHNHHEQIKRFASIRRIKSENVTVDLENQTAQIVGSEGTYDVALDSCTCLDFSIRRRPCKHIYRLAFELGLTDDLLKTDKKAAKAFKDSVPDEIERFKQLYFDGAISVEKFNKIVNALLSK